MTSQAILNRNRMTYEVSQPVSVKTRPHNTILQYFERQEYKPNDTMITSFASGKYFLDTTKSYISVNVKINAVGAPSSANFGSGSMANLFRNVRIFHKSGTTITSCQKNDIAVKAKDKIIRDDFWFSTIGKQQGYVDNPATDNNLESLVVDGVQFKIKLCDLHGFFKGYNDALMPPEIADGLRMELDVNTLAQAIQRDIAGGNITELEILKPNIQLCLVKVMDNAAVNVMNTAVNQGLSWTYDDVFVSNRNYNNNDNAITLAVDKAVSVAKNCLVLARDQPNINQIDADGYNFVFRQFNTQWCFTLGNDLMPWKQKVSYPQDAYSIALDCFQSRYGVNLTNLGFFGTGVNQTDCNGVYALNLLTDDYLEMSGDFINANKRLNFSIEKQTDEVASQWTTILTHTKVLRVNNTNSRVDE
jgi:hypothetical protein